MDALTIRMMLAYRGTPRLAPDSSRSTPASFIFSSPVLHSRLRLPGLTHDKFNSPANGYIEDRIDLNRELAPSPMSTGYITVTADTMSGINLFSNDLVLFDRASLLTSAWRDPHHLCVIGIVQPGFCEAMG